MVVNEGLVKEGYSETGRHRERHGETQRDRDINLVCS